MAASAGKASGKVATAVPGTIRLTGEQADKIKALMRLMKEHYNPLPAQLEMYLQLLPSAASAASGEEDSEDSAGPRHLQRSPVWSYCGSFLVSREWDVQKAFAMLQDVVAFRAANRLDEQCFFPPAVSLRGWSANDVCTVLRQSPRETGQRIDRVVAGVAQGISCGIHYWDKGGRPVVYMMVSSFDEVELMRQLKQMANVGKSHVEVMWEFMLHFIGVMESLVLYQAIQRDAQSTRRASASESAHEAPPAAELSQGVVTMVFDMKGLALKMLWKPVIDLLCSIAKDFFKYYPDQVHRIVYVNSPSLARYAFRLVRGVMPAAFQRKIAFVSSHDTLSTLETMIDKKHIPHFLGGDCRCATAGGECFTGYDPQHPRRTVKTGAPAEAREMGNDAFLTEDVTLAAGHECARVFPVKPSEVVAWEFAVAGGGRDITFTIFFVPQSAATQMQWAEVELKKLSSYVVTSEALADGSDVYTAAEDGVVVLGWRNTRSWLASKRLQLRAYKEANLSSPHECESNFQ
ncbi:hypothetical protein GH5_01548 [Leishmania sp. Ghana 2012 LV757]|uniref:hypothetical protein n=1 Tax=Leishmania sp. Ghana 2012 LV757 TaxID=2803181 RepID=UPI001B3F8EE6|nr:hypothetical protein GH5_01548 [Leishmania sp. Ghana 2012 LV757]